MKRTLLVLIMAVGMLGSVFAGPADAASRPYSHSIFIDGPGTYDHRWNQQWVQVVNTPQQPKYVPRQVVVSTECGGIKEVHADYWNGNHIAQRIGPVKPYDSTGVVIGTFTSGEYALAADNPRVVIKIIMNSICYGYEKEFHLTDRYSPVTL